MQENVNLVQSDRSQSDMNCRLISSCRHRTCINILTSYEHEETQINGAIDLGSTRLNATVLEHPYRVALQRQALSRAAFIDASDNGGVKSNRTIQWMPAHIVNLLLHGITELHDFVVLTSYLDEMVNYQ